MLWITQQMLWHRDLTQSLSFHRRVRAAADVVAELRLYHSEALITANVDSTFDRL